MKLFTKSDLKNSKYIVISKNVYDLNDFKHPVINERIHQYYGMDCTEIFQQNHDLKLIEKIKKIGTFINKREGIKEIQNIKMKIQKMKIEEMNEKMKEISNVIGIYDSIQTDFQMYIKIHGYRRSGKKTIISSLTRQESFPNHFDGSGMMFIETIIPCLFEDELKYLLLTMNMIGYQIQERYQYLNQQDKQKYDHHLIVMNLIDPISFEYAIKLYHEIKDNKIVIVTKMDLIDEFQISIQDVLETFEKVLFINSKNHMMDELGTFQIIQELIK